MKLRSFFAHTLLSLSFLPLGSLLAQSSDIDFSEDYERIYQIRVVSPDAGSKSSIGSGFQVSADGLIITNYHVVSDYVVAPDSHEIKYVTHDGHKGLLELLDFDVISDLAVLRHPQPAEDFFSLSTVPLDKGELSYALGNPSDWGIVMVPGPTNGFVEHSYEERVLFSGSLNPGMSGGPSLNAAGDVIGVNVATAGSQLSFLVPAEKALNLIKRNRIIKAADYNNEITQQIKTWQRPRIQDLIDIDWQVEDFSGRKLFGEIRRDFQCWGGTNDAEKESVIATVDKTCSAGDDIYLSHDLNAGQISFSFSTEESLKLNAAQFAKSQVPYMSADNRSSYDYSTNYICESHFVSGQGDLTDNKESSATKAYNRIVTCIRAYKKFAGLYDSLLLIHSHKNKEAFQSHLSLSAVERDQLKTLNKKFAEASL